MIRFSTDHDDASLLAAACLIAAGILPAPSSKDERERFQHLADQIGDALDELPPRSEPAPKTHPPRTTHPQDKSPILWGAGARPRILHAYRHYPDASPTHRPRALCGATQSPTRMPTGDPSLPRCKTCSKIARTGGR